MEGENYMGDLRYDRTTWTTLLTHIRKREGYFDYFYCDMYGLVTIGFGYLIDSRDTKDEHWRQKAAELHQTYPFSTTSGLAATGKQVGEDWQRVKDYWRENGKSKERAYADVAQLRISEKSV